jgi:putative regulator of septum formation
MAVLGKAIVGVAGLGLVGVGYAGVAGQDETARDNAGAVVEGGQVGALRIRTGDCFGDVPGATFEAVDAVPCSQPHKFEVFDAFNLPFENSAAYPGDESITTLADDGCFNRFAGFVGIAYAQSIYNYSIVYPLAGTWDEFDDREVMCLISNYDGTSKQGSARDTRQ